MFRVLDSVRFQGVRFRCRRGSVLVMVLWLLFFFSLLTAQAAYRARLDQHLLQRDLETVRSYYVARAGLHAAWDALVESRDDALGPEGQEGWARDDRQDGGLVRSLELEDTRGRAVGTCAIRIQDEHSFFPILRVDKDARRRFIGSFSRGVLERPAPDVPLEGDGGAFGGARGTGVLRRCFAGQEEIFYGEDANDNFILDPWEDDGEREPPGDDADGRLDVGAKGFVTVWTDGKVNVNTAPESVLRNLPGVSSDVLAALLTERRGKTLTIPEDLASLAPVTDAVFARLASWAVFRSDLWRVTVVGRAAASPVAYVIVAVVDRSSGVPRIRWCGAGSGRWGR